MTKTVYFVRHGQSVANVRGILGGAGDFPITDVGRSQAQEVAQVLKDVQFDLLVTSPLSRARETLNIITAELGISNKATIIKSEFAERDAGEFTGKPKKDYIAFIAAGGEAGETSEAMQQRVNRGLDWLREQDFTNALVVTHNGTARMIRIIVDDLPVQDFVNLPELDNGTYLKMDL